ncbi:heparan-alpha-glucosaminide N-acetyltransferase domain-containing protein [Streptomyces sp. A244]|uniref:heparan-alpha-glucosaminide N-acetyltransferase domain-containing protein n=1 Tax=Streptomyces sp. A244 TaxID=2137016 RepID=UPI0011B29B91|nr:heparan-alpha-glucosaminide N-acetyltransferase domain-containing protein [Streptomyces sp. A244]
MTSPIHAETTIQPAGSPPIAPKTGRLDGVDLARALAVLGMFVSHTGPALVLSGLGRKASTPAHFLGAVSDGHASILFATLAGVSLALLTGGSRPHHGVARRRDRARIAVRAAILFVLGMALAQISTEVIVILSFYALCFLLALPLLRVPPRFLAVLAAAWAVAGPVVSFFVRREVEGSEGTGGGALMFRDLTSLPDAGSGLLRLVLDGTYPVVTWMPFVLAGLAVGRLDLRSTTIRLRLLAAGVALAVAGSGGSWLALHAFGGLAALQPKLDFMRPVAAGLTMDPLELMQTSNLGTVPTDTPANLLLDGPHSGTPFEIVGSVGCALAVLALCLLVGDRFRTLLAPLTAVGALSLTAYTAQVVALRFLPSEKAMAAHPWVPLLGFVLGAVAFCGLWRRFLGRGPLERLMHWASTRASAALARGASGQDSREEPRGCPEGRREAFWHGPGTRP